MYSLLRDTIKNHTLPIPGTLSLMETRWGRRLGRYEIVAEVGRGAMGVVYKARDPKIDRFVAVKTIALLGQAQEDERDYRERFFFEAQAAGRLLHPGIVTVFDVGEEPQTHDPFIVMEYITGESLKQKLAGENKTVPLETALRLTEQIAEALDYAHGQGVVHRDVKPANILITEDGTAKITDFGIAKLSLAHLTVPGHVLGTPAYMAPEQLEGEQVDGRSDLFSLGVILYSMLTGYRPFQGNSATTVCFKVVNRDPVPVSALASDLPPDVDAIVSRAMAKEPAQRYQRGIEFALDVRELREGLATQSTSSVRTSTGSQVRSSSALHAHNSGASYPWTVQLRRVLLGHDSLATFLRTSDRLTLLLLFAGVVLAVAIGTITLRSTKAEIGAAGTNGLSLGANNLPPSSISPSPAKSETPAKAVTRTAPPVASAASKPVTTPSKPAVRRQPKLVSPSPASSPQAAEKDANTAVSSGSLLYLQVWHHFSDADLVIWVDGKLVYSMPLHAETQRRMVLFHSTKGTNSKQIWVSAGSHNIRVRVQSAAAGFDQSQTLAVQFKGDDEKTLRIAFDKGNKAMSLTID